MLAVIAVCLLAATGAGAFGTHGGPLTGTWSGWISGSAVKRRHIVIVVNRRETGGSWRINSTCHGSLTLDSISGGYHHYRRHAAPGSRCSGGDVDCLKRVGKNVDDAITSHLGGEYDAGGTLRRVTTP